MYYNKQGNKITKEEWIVFLTDPKEKIIEQTTLPDGKWVSTIWIGFDYSFGKEKPLIFETTVFLEKDEWGEGELDCERYSTLEEAKEGHKKMCEKYAIR